jgi:DNA repair protein RadC
MAKQLSYLDKPGKEQRQDETRKGVTIRDLPATERPRQRLERLGPSALSTPELIAIILGTGTEGESALDMAYRLVAHHEGLAGLARASFSELVAERGMGAAKTAQLMAALELGRRMTLTTQEERPTLYTPADAATLLMAEIGHQEQEHFCVIFLDARYRIMGIQTLYKGNLTLTQIRVGEVFREAIRRNCARILVAHNHPSGDPTPSPDDIALTRQLVDAGRLLGIEVVDHLVIGFLRWVSMRDRRIGFE